MWLNQPRTYGAVLVLIMLSALLVRTHALDRFSTGYDELFSVLEANGLHPHLLEEGKPFTKADLMAHNNMAGVRAACIATDGGNGMLYVSSLHLWTKVFGNGNLSIRGLSLVWGMLVVVLLHWLTLRLFNDRAMALIAALFAALSPILVDYSQEARSYMPATALSLAATMVYWRSIKAPGKGSTVVLVLTYGVLAGSALLHHYSTVYVFGGHALHALLYVRPLKRWRGLIGAAVIGALMLGTWMVMGGREGLLNMAKQQAYYQMVITTTPDFDEYMRAARPANLLQDLVVQALWLSGNALQFIGPPLKVMALLLVLPLLLLLGLRHTSPDQRSAVTLLAILSLTGPLYALATSILAGHTFGMRYYYVIFSAPFVTLLMALGLIMSWRSGNTSVRWLLAGSGACLLFIMAASVAWLHQHGFRGNNAVERVRPFAQEITNIVASDPQGSYVILHKNERDALQLNLHLGGAARYVPQRVDVDLPDQCALFRTDQGMRLIRSL